jgi:succinoglycan biosynthesis transport protein ExoP
MQGHDGRQGAEPLLGRAFRHYPLLLLVFALVGGLAATLYAGFNPSSYTSSARVLINPTAGNPYNPSPTATRADQLTSMETEAQMLRSDDVLTMAAETLSSPPALASLSSRLDVVVPTNTQVLEISFSAADADRAREVTQAVATAYLDYRLERSEEVTGTQLERVQNRIAAVISNLREATRLSQEGPEGKRAFQGRLADALSNELVNLRTQQNTLENAAGQPGRIISPATQPDEGSILTMLLFAAGGALVGLLLGLAVAVAVERRRNLVRAGYDVEAAGLPVLAAVPRAASPSRRTSATATHKFDEGVRRLRASLTELGEPARVVAVAGQEKEAVAGSLADALAVSLARAGHRVVLVDARVGHDPARPEPDGSGGWSELLAGSTDEALLVPCNEPGLYRLPRGGSLTHPRDLVVKERVTHALRTLMRAADFVIVHAPDVNTPEGGTFAGAVDRTVVPVLSHRTNLAVVTDTVERARVLDASVAAVLVRTEGKAAAVEAGCQVQGSASSEGGTQTNGADGANAVNGHTRANDDARPHQGATPSSPERSTTPKES